MKYKQEDKMTFDEFLGWGVRYLFDTFLMDGAKGLRSGLHLVVTNALNREKYNGWKKA